MKLSHKYRLKLLLALAFMLFTHRIVLPGQAPSIKEYHHFIVEFYDKNKSPYSIQNPEEFLSPRALERRKKLGIEITEEDLPVNPHYIDSVSKVEGVQVLHVSKWFNLVSVRIDLSQLEAQELLKISVVKSVKYLGSTPIHLKNSKDSSVISTSQAFEKLLMQKSELSKTKHNVTYDSEYGAAQKQIAMLDGQKLHHYGYKGEGVMVAVLDAGFKNVNKMACFQHLFEHDRIKAVKDFVDFDDEVYSDDGHGTQVLSCMASLYPNLHIGTAPEADYVLIRTENEHSETRIEELSWIAGAEFADSIGVDVLNSSLGYTQFDDKKFSFTHNMLDGKTTLITRAADKLFTKGVLVMNSAGNDGATKWLRIGAPADGFNVIASGSVTEYMERSNFSSTGPTYDGRVKPDIVALGTQTAVFSPSAQQEFLNGTSFSNPVLCGMIACLIQAAPQATLPQIVNAVFASASHAQAPYNKLGYGVPNFDVALAILGKHPQFDYSKSTVWTPNFTTQYHGLAIRYYAAKNQKVTMRFQVQNKKGKFKTRSKFKTRLSEGAFFATPWLINIVRYNKSELGSASCRLVVKGKGVRYYRDFQLDFVGSSDELEVD